MKTIDLFLKTATDEFGNQIKGDVSNGFRGMIFFGGDIDDLDVQYIDCTIEIDGITVFHNSLSDEQSNLFDAFVEHVQGEIRKIEQSYRDMKATEQHLYKTANW